MSPHNEANVILSVLMCSAELLLTTIILNLNESNSSTYKCNTEVEPSSSLYYFTMGVRRHGLQGAFAPPPWKCKVFFCISSYSKTPSRQIIYASFSILSRSEARDPTGVPSLDPAWGTFFPDP